MGDAWIGKLVAASSPLGLGDDEAATPKAGKVIRQKLPGNPDVVGEIARIATTSTQPQQNLGTRRIRQCVPEPGQGIALHHRLHVHDNTSNSEFIPSLTLHPVA